MRILKLVSTIIFLIIICLISLSQTIIKKIIWEDIDSIETNQPSPSQKLIAYYNLKNKFELFNQAKDSIYARILNKIGAYEAKANNNYKIAISYTLPALKINTSSNRIGSKIYAVYNYFNLGNYFESLMIFDESLKYFDSSTKLAITLKDTNTIIDALAQSASLYLQTGDYQKCTELSIEGINYSLQKENSFNYLQFLNQKAQSLIFQNRLNEAYSDAETIIRVSKIQKNDSQLATAFRMKALIYGKRGFPDSLNSFFRKSIAARIKIKDYNNASLDYNDLGNFYDTIKNYNSAAKYYTQALVYAGLTNDSIMLSRININLDQINFDQKKYSAAACYIIKALQLLKININKNILINPSIQQVNSIGDKELILTILNNKVELLLQLYKIKQNKKYLDACLQTSLITNNLITKMRQFQVRDQSKLYWREHTRIFFSNTMEACYLANNPALAFYFMEKSRAVLLNDKLNELGAGIKLPHAESDKEENYQINITQLQLQLSSLDESSEAYSSQRNKLLLAKEDYEHYIKSLEQKYPSYYQYKYADNVPPLKTLQQFLAKNNHSFIHYFLNDSVIYALAITANNTKLIKLTDNNILNKLSTFLQLVSDKNALNNHYNNFGKLSNNIYKVLFQPLQLPKEKVIICTDNFLIPFEALCTDEQGKRFLINDYVFSYAYSARYVLNKFNDYKASGNFLGIAPVSFASYLNVPQLMQSASALDGSAKYYSDVQLLENGKAVKSSFIKQLPLYTVVNIFSHASADTSQKEPILFMTDSTVGLSELQLINNPATKLVILSACETNVGKNEAGEGIYSLARGFATTGVPSVAATLWKADEQAIYAITNNFNLYISQGLNKDYALQKAKLDFIKTNSGDKLLPYYWANIILIGNTAPISLTHDNHVWFWLALCSFIVIIIFVLILKNKKLFM